MYDDKHILLKVVDIMLITNKQIDNGKAFDWGKASGDYAKYRDIYPSEFYEKMIELNLCTKGQNVLDLGTGTGVLPRNLYKYGAHFTGADISENQIEQAKMLSKNANMDIDYIVASAEEIDFPAETFDVVTACQCFMYFNKEISLPKIHRVLKKDGHFAVLFMAWLPDESSIAKTSEELVLKYNPNWTGAKMQRYPVSTPDWLGDLFVKQDSISFDINLTFTRESWHGRMKACRGIGASSLSESEIASWEQEHLAYMNTLPEKFDIIHYVTIQNVRKQA